MRQSQGQYCVVTYRPIIIYVYHSYIRNTTNTQRMSSKPNVDYVDPKCRLHTYYKLYCETLMINLGLLW